MESYQKTSHVHYNYKLKGTYDHEKEINKRQGREVPTICDS